MLYLEGPLQGWKTEEKGKWDKEDSKQRQVIY